MPEATSPKDETTSADTVKLPDPPDPYFYNCTRVWPATADALVWGLGERRRMITGSELPPAPDATESDYRVISQWQAEVHAALERLGVIDAYRAHLAGGAYAVHCPWWCAGKHPMLVDGHLGQVIHESAAVAGVDFSDKADLHGESTWQLKLTQWEGPISEDGFEFGPVCLDASGEMPEQLDLEDTQCVADAYRRGSERFAEILEISDAAHTVAVAA